MIRCRACGTDNENYMEFCNKCATELPREGRAREPAQAPVIPIMPGGAQGMTFDPQPYDYRLPYRPGRGFPQGYERHKSDPRAPMPPEPYPQRSEPKPSARLNAQLPPIPEPQGRVLDAPIVRIPDTYIPPPQPPQAPGAPVMQLPPEPMPQKAMPPVAYEPQEQAQAQLFEQDEPQKPKKSKDKPPKPPKPPKGRKRAYDDDYEEEYDDDDDYDEPPRRSSALTVMLMVSLAILLFAAVWFAGSYINNEYGNVGNFVQSVLKLATPAPTEPPVPPAQSIRIDIKADTGADGRPTHSLMFYGEAGKKIELPSIGTPNYSRTLNITEVGVASLGLEDRLFIPAETDAQTPAEITVKLQANLIDTDGQVYPLDVPEFTIAVPQVGLSLTSPAETSITLEAPELVLSGNVTHMLQQGAAQLIIDGSDATALLDALGNFSYNYEVADFGERTITIEARAPYHRAMSTTLNVNYLKRDVAIAVNNAAVNEADPYRAMLDGTEDETIEVSGTFEANAALSVEGTLDGDPTIDAAAGTFTFAAKLETQGLNTFNIIAEKDGGKSTLVLTVERKPNADEYTRQARTLDYDSLAKTADEKKGRIYFCKDGKISSVIQKTPYQIFTYNVGTEDKPKNILMEYYGAIAIDETKNYRIYGDVVGLDTEQNLPKLIARFIFE